MAARTTSQKRSMLTLRAQADLVAIRNTAREIARGMNYLHSMDVLHGDLTAGNILLSSSGAVDRRGFIAKVLHAAPLNMSCAGRSPEAE